jgi:Fur family ferric uptake transcriptional regulator
MSDPDLETLRQRLRQDGSRLTRPRRAVAHVMAEAESVLTPEDVHARAASACPGIGLVTVYRTLDLLAELGYVSRVHLEANCHGYARRDLDHGHHVICRRCQTVVEFPGTEDLSPLVRRVARRTGFRVEGHLLELVGLCPSCQDGGREAE